MEIRTCKSYSQVAAKNRMYRAEFEAKRILRRLPSRFIVADLREIMQGIQLLDTRNADPVERCAENLRIANNYAQWLRRRGFIKREDNQWSKL